MMDWYRLIRPIKRLILLLVSKGVVTGTQVNEDGKSQRLQVDLGNGQVYDQIERVQPFGLSSNPETDAQAIVLSINGNRDHSIIIQVDDNKYRLAVEKGNVALYNKGGMAIHLKGDSILVDKGLGGSLIDLDGVVTGQQIDTFTGMKMGTLPGANANGLANSLKLKVAL